LKSPVREYRSPGSVRGAPGNRRPYLDTAGAEHETLRSFRGRRRARQRLGLRQSPGAFGRTEGGLARRESLMAKRSQGKRPFTAGVGLDFDLWQVCDMLPSPICPEALLPSLLGLMDGQEGRSV
jgi:hypothetical protein